MKIKATQLLRDNVGNTFVTPVFGGSASLRDAAGQLIENTVKSVRRKEEVNDAYYEKLFQDTTALYRLDQLGAPDERVVSGKADLGPLPGTAVVLLAGLALSWGLILLYVAGKALKRRYEKNVEILK